MSSQLKLHRFDTKLDGKAFTVMTPRPSINQRFATNRYHETWHILTDGAGAQLLSRILWWLSYQRAPNSIVVLDEDVLVPNPFDADPSSPIAIFNADTTHLGRKATDELRSTLRKKPRSEGTVKVSTPRLQTQLQDRDNTAMSEHWKRRSPEFELTDRVNGVVRVAASTELLRWWSIWIADLGTTYYRGTSNRYLGPRTLPRFQDGEVQTFRWFTSMVNDAVQLRDRMFPGTSHRELVDVDRRAIHAALPANHTDRSRALDEG